MDIMNIICVLLKNLQTLANWANDKLIESDVSPSHRRVAEWVVESLELRGGQRNENFKLFFQSKLEEAKKDHQIFLVKALQEEEWLNSIRETSSRRALDRYRDETKEARRRMHFASQALRTPAGAIVDTLSREITSAYVEDDLYKEQTLAEWLDEIIKIEMISIKALVDDVKERAERHAIDERNGDEMSDEEYAEAMAEEMRQDYYRDVAADLKREDLERGRNTEEEDDLGEEIPF